MPVALADMRSEDAAEVAFEAAHAQENTLRIGQSAVDLYTSYTSTDDR